jgi:hypothetical protein
MTASAISDEPMKPTVATQVRRFRWLIWCAVAAIIVAGTFFYGFGQAGGVSRSDALAACAMRFGTNSSLNVADIQPAVVGLGNSDSLAAANTASGWRWCDVQSSGAISGAQLRAPVGVITAVHDGNLQSDILMLIHLSTPTVSVAVTTVSSRSVVLSHGGGFEVLRVPIANWPKWHAPWSRVPVALGRIIGFDSEGRVTSSQSFTWCPGALNTVPGAGC